MADRSESRAIRRIIPRAMSFEESADSARKEEIVTKNQSQPLPDCEVWIARRHRALPAIGGTAPRGISERGNRLADRAQEQDRRGNERTGRQAHSDRHLSMAQQSRASAVPRKLREFVWALRTDGYDCAIDFQGLLKSAFFAYLSGAPVRIGWERDFLKESVSRIFYTEVVKPKRDSHHRSADGIAATAWHRAGLVYRSSAASVRKPRGNPSRQS